MELWLDIFIQVPPSLDAVFEDTRRIEEQQITETTGTPGRRSRVSETDLNQTAASNSVSQVSMSVTNSLGPEKDMADHLASVEEEAEKNGENDQSLANPTPLMKDMMKKRRSVAPKTAASKSPVKAKMAAATPISPMNPAMAVKAAISAKRGRGGERGRGKGRNPATPRVSRPTPATPVTPQVSRPAPATYATPRVSKPSSAANIPSPDEETPSRRTRGHKIYLDNSMI